MLCVGIYDFACVHFNEFPAVWTGLNWMNEWMSMNEYEWKSATVSWSAHILNLLGATYAMSLFGLLMWWSLLMQ